MIMGTEKTEDEAELIAGFLSRQPAREVAFVVAMKFWIRKVVRRNFARQWRHLEDIEQSALLELCELRDTEKGAMLIQPPLWDVAKMTVERSARMFEREKRMLPLKDRYLTGAQDLASAFELNRLMEIAEGLPRGMARTMLAHAAYETGEGPPLEVALGTDHRSALRRLARAQAAVVRIARGETIEEGTEDDDE